MPIIEIIASTLGIASSILSAIAFWRDRIRHRVWFIVGSILFGVMANYIAWSASEKRQAAEIEKIEAATLRTDARTTADAIIITGWEEAGDCVGYLAQIVGFYSRHSGQYQSEYSTYTRQLKEWQDFLAINRSAGKAIYASDWENLRGLVKSGDQQLEEIAAMSKIR